MHHAVGINTLCCVVSSRVQFFYLFIFFAPFEQSLSLSFAGAFATHIVHFQIVQLENLMLKLQIISKKLLSFSVHFFYRPRMMVMTTTMMLMIHTHTHTCYIIIIIFCFCFCYVAIVRCSVLLSSSTQMEFGIYN